MGTVEDLGILDLPPALVGHVKLEAGDGIELTYDYAHNAIVITKSAAPKSNPGEITEAVIDTFDFAGVADHYPEILHIAGNVFAVVTMFTAGPGQVFTITIDSEGNIGDSKIDSLTFEAGVAYTPTIIHIAGTTYAIAYRDAASDGWLKTVSITDAGVIGDNPLDTLEFDEDRGQDPSIVHVAESIYAIAYYGPSLHGWLKTVYIGSDGVIGDDTIAALEFDTTRGAMPVIVRIAPNIFAIAYQGAGNDGYLKTIGISDAGLITDPEIAIYEFESDNCGYPAIVTLSEGVIAIAYIGPLNDGWIKTFAIDDTGAITMPSLDIGEFYVGSVNFPSIVHVAENVYAIAHKGDDADGFLTTALIEEDGTITDPKAFTYEFDPTKCDYSTIITAHPNLVAIAYRDNDLHGRLVTVAVDP